MYCSKCGAYIPEGETVCVACGTDSSVADLSGGAAQTGAVETIVTAASTAPVQTTQAAEETTQAVTTEKQSSPVDGESAPSQQESPVEAEEPGTEASGKTENTKNKAPERGDENKSI